MAKLNNNAIVTQLDMANYRTWRQTYLYKNLHHTTKGTRTSKDKKDTPAFTTHTGLISTNLSQVPILFSNFFAFQTNQIN